MALSDWMSTKIVLAKQREKEIIADIEDYHGAFNVEIERVDNLSYTGTCPRCGRTAAGMTSKIPTRHGPQIICNSCTREKAEEHGFILP